MDVKQASVNNTTWLSQTEKWQQINLYNKGKCIWHHQQLVRSLLRHFADHVVEDASMVEVGQLHIRVVPHPHLENLPGVQLHTTHMAHIHGCTTWKKQTVAGMLATGVLDWPWRLKPSGARACLEWRWYSARDRSDRDCPPCLRGGTPEGWPPFQQGYCGESARSSRQWPPWCPETTDNRRPSLLFIQLYFIKSF